MRLVIIGCGEVARCYASSFSAASLVILHPQAGRKSALHPELAVEWKDAPGPWLENFDVVLSCVNGAASLAAASSVLPFLKAEALFADLSTAAPADKRAAAAAAGARHVTYVDAVILIPVSIAGPRATLACAGPGGERFRALMNEVGAPVRILPGAPGDAASLKLLRSLFLKGLEAVAVESMAAAERFGLRGELQQILAEFEQMGARTMVEMLVRTHLLHARRRGQEVAQMQAQLEQIGLPTVLLAGIGAAFSRTTRDLASQPVRALPTLEAAVAWLASSRDRSQPQ